MIQMLSCVLLFCDILIRRRCDVIMVCWGLKARIQDEIVNRFVGFIDCTLDQRSQR